VGSGMAKDLYIFISVCDTLISTKQKFWLKRHLVVRKETKQTSMQNEKKKIVYTASNTIFNGFVLFSPFFK
jgi:hypothetical protein